MAKARSRFRMASSSTGPMPARLPVSAASAASSASSSTPSTPTVLSARYCATPPPPLRDRRLSHPADDVVERTNGFLADREDHDQRRHHHADAVGRQALVLARLAVGPVQLPHRVFPAR